MADKSEISFGYDISGFTKAMQEMSKSMKNMTENTKNMTGKITKGAFNAIAGAKVLFAALAAGFKGAMGMVQEVIPEIGTTFGIMQNIIAKNLLWPLRQALLPLLQKLLGWVEKNREMFVLMGGVLVNAFKMIKSLFESVLNMVKPIIDVIKETLKSIFGDTAKSIADTLNLIMLKIMVFGMMVSNFLKPIFEGLAFVIRAVINAVKEFGAGFTEGLSGLSGGMDIMQSLKSILESIGEVIKILNPLFREIGKILGSEFVAGVRVLNDALKILVDLLHGTFDVKNLKDLGMAYVDMVKSLFSKTPTGKLNPNVTVKDAIITKSGKVVHTDPNDTIFATKNPHGMGGSHIEVIIPGMSLNVTEGNAVNAGENFGRGIARQIKNILLDDMTLEGT
jgi:hypothetical protein